MISVRGRCATLRPKLFLLEKIGHAGDHIVEFGAHIEKELRALLFLITR